MIVDINNISFPDPKGFLVLDGVNGAGKTTLQKRIVEYVEQKGFAAIPTREPGATLLGKEIRPLLLENKEKPFELTEMFLFAADRAEHVQKVIKPALAQQQLVVCDRYYYSTTAFQGYGREIDLKTIETINQIAINNTYPDFVIILDLDPARGLQRNSGEKNMKTSRDIDNFEKEKIQFHERLRHGFLKMARNYEEQFIILDGAKTAEQVFEDARPLVDLWLSSLQAVRNTSESKTE